MVIEMQTDVFRKAAIAAGIVFLIGIVVAGIIDYSRIIDIREGLDSIEEEWRSGELEKMIEDTKTDRNSCDDAIKKNMDFADSVYYEGIKIEGYERINRISPNLIKEKKRYALLQMRFWENSIELKENCDADYNTLVYMFAHEEDDDLEHTQMLQSGINLDLKDRCGSKLMLINLPTDLDIPEVDAVMEKYSVTTAPSVIINEKVVFQGLTDAETIGRVINC